MSLRQLLNACLRGGVLVSRLALVVGLAKLVAPAELGLYGLFTVTVTYAMLVAGLDFYAYSQRELLFERRHSAAFILRHHAATCGFAYLVVLPAMSMVFAFGHLPFWMFPWFAVLLVTEHAAQEINRFLIVTRRPLTAGCLLFLRQGIWVWIMLALMWLEPTWRRLDVLFGCWLAGSILALIFGGVLIHSKIEWESEFQWNWAWVRKGLRTGAMFLLATLCLRGMLTFDRYIVESMAGLDLLGVYTLYVSIAMAVMNFIDASVFVFRFPILAAVLGKGQQDRYRLEWRRMWRDTILSLTLVILVAGLVGFIVVEAIETPVYRENIDILWWLLCAIGLYVLSMVPHYGLYAMRADRPILTAHISGFIGFIPVALGLSSYWPRLGVPIALVVVFAWLGLFKGSVYWRVQKHRLSTATL